METSKNKWEGLRAIIVGRQSDDAKGTASTEAQLDHIKKVLAALGMRVVDTVALEGISAAGRDQAYCRLPDSEPCSASA